MPSHSSKNKPQTPVHKQSTGTNRVSGLNIGAEGTKRRFQEVKATQHGQRSKHLHSHRQKQQELGDNDRDSFTQNTSSTTTRTTKGWTITARNCVGRKKGKSADRLIPTEASLWRITDWKCSSLCHRPTIPAIKGRFSSTPKTTRLCILGLTHLKEFTLNFINIKKR